MFWAILAFCYKGILLSILQVRNSLVYDKEVLVIPESLSSRCPDSMTKEECPQNSTSRATAAQLQLTTTMTEVKSAGNKAPCWHFSTAAIALLCSKDCSLIHKVAAHVLGEKPFFHPHIILFCRTEGKIHLFSKYFKKTNHFCFKLTPHTEDVTQERSRETPLLCRNANTPKHTSGPLQTGGILCVTLPMAKIHHIADKPQHNSVITELNRIYTHTHLPRLLSTNRKSYLSQDTGTFLILSFLASLLRIANVINQERKQSTLTRSYRGLLGKSCGWGDIPE